MCHRILQYHCDISNCKEIQASSNLSGFSEVKHTLRGTNHFISTLLEHLKELANTVVYSLQWK